MTKLPDFSNLAAVDVTEETLREFVWDRIPGRPSVWVAPANDQNPAFLNARLRVSIERSQRPEPATRQQTTPKTLAAQIDEDRETDRILIAEACAKRWGRAPVAADGTRPDFSYDNCLAFFRALPNYMFDPLRGFAQNVYNFAPSVVTDEEAEKLGNGSPPA